MSNYSLFSSSLRTCRSETEIRNIFERHMKGLIDQKWKMISEISEWENNLVRQIHENAVKQKATVEQICKEQVNRLKTQCQEFLETALVYEDRKDREEIRQLLEQCHALKMTISVFEYPEEPIPFIRLRETKPSVTAVDKSQKKSTIDDGLRKVTIENAHTSRSAFTSSSQTKLPSATSVMMVDKCPACFVIFPPTMSTDERSRHVNQHFGDN